MNKVLNITNRAFEMSNEPIYLNDNSPPKEDSININKLSINEMNNEINNETTTTIVTPTPVLQDNIIKLNIGGTIYLTSISTLTSDSSSMFSLMFSGRFNIQKSNDGSIFIDRDGKYFYYILNWLRSSFIPWIPNQAERESVLNEARYYQIQNLIDHIKEQQITNTPNLDEQTNKFTQKEIIQLVNLSNNSSLPIQLASGNLSGLNLSGLNFQGANLKFANLEGSQLKYCNFDGANMESANLKNCDLRFSNVSMTNLVCAQLQNSQLQNSNFGGSNLLDAELCDAQLQNADFTNSNLSGANLQGANLLDTNLNGCRCTGTSFLRVVNVQRAKGLKR